MFLFGLARFDEQKKFRQGPDFKPNTEWGFMEEKRHRRNNSISWPLLALFAVICSPGAMASLPPECGTLENHFGPFDYTVRTPQNLDNLRVVEKAHFDGNVARLQTHSKCKVKRTCSSVAGDMAYTLAVFPNHHEALLSMTQYHLQGLDKARRPMRYSPDCYFLRAIAFRPRDATVRMIFAYYPSKVGRMDAARNEYQAALEIAPDSAEVNYNAGLFFLDLNEIDKAAVYAARAYQLGHPLSGLRNRLLDSGVDIDDIEDEP